MSTEQQSTSMELQEGEGGAGKQPANVSTALDSPARISGHDPMVHDATCAYVYLVADSPHQARCINCTFTWTGAAA
jgi:hypothetical protein